MNKMKMVVACAGVVVWTGASSGAGISLPADPGEVTSYAAAEIRDYVKKATGESWTVVTNAPVGMGVAFRFVEDRKLGEDGLPTFDDSPNPGSILSGGNLWIILAGVVVVVGALVALVVVKKKKKPVLAGENNE